MDAYDVVIIGTGAGGGTLARRLAPSGKKILLLERGDWLAVQFADDVGMKSVIEVARELGIRSDLPNVPSLALGTADVNLLEDDPGLCGDCGQRGERRALFRALDRARGAHALYPAAARPQPATPSGRQQGRWCDVLAKR